MNPAIFNLLCLTIADVHTDVRRKANDPEDHLSADLCIRLDMLGALIHHGVIVETPDEIADAIVSDFRNHSRECDSPLIAVLRKGDPDMYRRITSKSEENIRHIAKTCAERALASYVDSLRKEGLDPDTLPKISIPDPDLSDYRAPG